MLDCLHEGGSMKLVMLFLLMNLAYAQNDVTEAESEKEEKSEVQKQEETPSGPIENPFLVGPYKGNDYIYFDRLKQEKEQAEEEKSGP